MDSDGLTYLPNLFSLLSLTVAITAALVAGGSYWRRHHRESTASPLTPPPASRITYREAPTVRLIESQRVDRLRKQLRMTPSQSIDVLETRTDLPPRFRITLKRIVEVEGGPVAQIAVGFGGTAVSCGPLVEEVAFNEFVLPRASRNEPRNCVFHYQESGDALDFMRIKLRSVDPALQWAELDVLQVSGHWPSG